MRASGRPPVLTTVLALVLLGSDLPARPVWDARAAEHLFNRAGFGATPAEIAEAVAAGRVETVRRLLDEARGEFVPLVEADRSPFSDRVRVPPRLDSFEALLERTEVGASSPLVMDSGFYFDEGYRRVLRERRMYVRDWLARMVSGRGALRERMALFWHGHFVTSFDALREADELVRQIERFRRDGLGDVRVLVRGVARDPAMLRYLDNASNAKGAGNENWARELLELFVLGEGRYTESDVRDVARAFTGWTTDAGEFRFAHEDHDWGPKRVLGVTGNLGGEAVLQRLFELSASAEHLARELVTWFEGVAPTPERVDRYAQLLRDQEFRTDGFLEALFLDDAFYREEVVGTRVASPVEFFVGLCRRLGCEPPPDMIYVVAALCGQELLSPPNVEGWTEGRAWLSTGHLVQRGNCAALLLGEFDRETRPLEVRDRMLVAVGREFDGPYRDYLAMLAWLQARDWRPEPPRALRAGDLGAVLDAALAVPVPERLETALAEVLEARADTEAEGLRLLRILLCLPEAQVL